MRQLTTLITFILLAVMPLSLQATHIVGGEMTYKCLGNDQYEIKLTVFRDCFNGIPWFDNPAAIGVFSNETNLLLNNILVPLDPMLNDTIDPTLDDDCLAIPPNVCVNTTTYTTTVFLPFIPGGYHLVYQRCCRNNTIVNLIAPEDVGATYSIVISENALLECNNSPVFNEWPPLFLCANVPFNIDQSAVDDDGDSLVYKLCNPLTGASDINPQPQPPNPPPYDTVPWLPPYDVSTMINLPPDMPMTINSETGLLTGIPTILGQFVIGICVEEYRDGELIGVNRRDYQVNIGDCEAIVSAFLEPETICGSLTVDFINESINANDFEWFFNDPGNPGAMSTDVNPSYTYSDYGEYEVVLVAAPGAICVDTFTAVVSVQPNSLLPDFEVELVECLENVLIELTDLSVDTFSTIESWEWVLTIGGIDHTSTDQHPVFEVTPPGGVQISLTVTSANGCSATAMDILPIKPPLLILDLGPDVEDCLVDEVELDAGPGFATYLWNDGSDGQTLLVTAPGTYSVTVTDLCGQMQDDAILVTLNGPDLDLGPDVEICEGGSHTFAATGFDVYEWTPSDFLSCDDCPDPTTTPDMTVTYIVTGTTADGCASTDTVTVTVLTNIETSESIAICDGETTIVFGNPVSTSGEFSVTFTSQDGCDSIHTITVTVLPTTHVIEDAQICDGDTVFIFGNPVSVSGMFSDTLVAANGCDSIHTINLAVLPNSFTFETISICFGGTADIFGVPTSNAGDYEMTFLSDNGCDSTHTITLEVYDEITIQIQNTDATCFGSADGSATASASGGTGGFLYAWSNGDAGETANNLAAGDHTVTVIDATGCIATATVTIGQPDAVELTVSGIDVSCDELGSVSASAIGGIGDITFVWSTGDDTTHVSGLVAGVYAVTVTDENGCTDSDSVEINGALGPQVSINIDQQLTEDEPDSGELSVEITGGTAPFDIEWNNGSTSSSLEGLSSGQYIVTVTDANGCPAIDTAYLFVEACTGGKIWNDVDRDGCKEGGEYGMGGVELSLSGTDIWGNAINATTTSAINGEYIFEGLPPGDYQITMVVPDGFTLSPPNACTDDFSDSDFDANGVGLDIISLVEGHCCLIVDGGLYDSCLNVTDPGEICCDQELCGPGNDPAPITSASPAIGAAQIQYMWIYSHVPSPPSFGNGAWQPVNDPFGNPVMTESYDPGPISETTYYARCVKAAGCSDWIEGNSVKITVSDDAVAEIDEPSGICVGDQVVFTAAPNDLGATYHWNFGPWANPSTSNDPAPTVTWAHGGYITISLTVTANGCTSVDHMLIAVSSDPVYCGTAITSPGNGTSFPTIETNATMGESFQVYPNPVTDKLIVEWDGDVQSAVQVEVMGMTGRMLLTDEVPANTRYFTTNMNHLNPGIYLLRLRYNDGQQKVFKLVKQ